MFGLNVRFAYLKFCLSLFRFEIGAVLLCFLVQFFCACGGPVLIVSAIFLSLAAVLYYRGLASLSQFLHRDYTVLILAIKNREYDGPLRL